jgi:hypothetical protein
MFSMDLAIRAGELSKQYDMYPRPIDRLIGLVTGRPRHSVLPALFKLLELPLTRGEYDVLVFVGDENAMTVFDRHNLHRGSLGQACVSRSE